jgi:hypothetical protein
MDLGIGCGVLVIGYAVLLLVNLPNLMTKMSGVEIHKLGGFFTLYKGFGANEWPGGAHGRQIPASRGDWKRQDWIDKDHETYDDKPLPSLEDDFPFSSKHREENWVVIEVPFWMNIKGECSIWSGITWCHSCCFSSFCVSILLGDRGTITIFIPFLHLIQEFSAQISIPPILMEQYVHQIFPCLGDLTFTWDGQCQFGKRLGLD